MAIFLIAPAIGWTWPALAPIVGAVAAALGFKTFSDPKGIVRGVVSQQLDAVRLERVPLDAVLSEIVAEELGVEERITFRREDIVLVFRKDAQGKFFVDVLGPSEMSKTELVLIGEEFAREVVRKFAYNRIMEQMEKVNVTVVDERVEPDGRIIMQARKWE